MTKTEWIDRLQQAIALHEQIGEKHERIIAILQDTIKGKDCTIAMWRGKAEQLEAKVHAQPLSTQHLANSLDSTSLTPDRPWTLTAKSTRRLNVYRAATESAFESC